VPRPTSCPAPWLSAAALAALIAAVAPAGARASGLSATAAAVDGKAAFQLRNAANATRPTGQVFALIVPPSTVATPGPTDSPLTILPGSTAPAAGGSVDVGLLDLESNGVPEPGRVLGLNFGAGGLAPGAVFNFALGLQSGFQGPLTLELITAETIATLRLPPDITATPGSITFGETPMIDPDPPTNPIPTPPNQGIPGPQVPEPGAIALWSALAGLGLLRVRAARRAAASRS